MEREIEGMEREIELLVRKLKHAATCGRRFTAGAARVGMSYAVATRFSGGEGPVGMEREIELLVRKLKHAAMCGRRFTAGAPRVGMSRGEVPLSLCPSMQNNGPAWRAMAVLNLDWGE